MGLSQKYTVKLILEIPCDFEVLADSEEEATDKALDKAMEFVELNTLGSREFDNFWEYYVMHKIISVK